MRKLFRITGLLALGVLAALLVAGGLLAVEVLSREPLRTVMTDGSSLNGFP